MSSSITAISPQNNRHPVSGVTALAHVDVAEESNLAPVVDRMRQLHARIHEHNGTTVEV